MNIQQAAKASGLPADTIRFYERKGILPAPPRRTNGYRDYTERHVATLRLASGLRSLGVPLARLGEVLQVAHSGTCHDLRDSMLEALEKLVADVERRLAELASTRDDLARILEGLHRMEAPDEPIPGVVGCDCIRLATTDDSGKVQPT